MRPQHPRHAPAWCGNAVARIAVLSLTLCACSDETGLPVVPGADPQALKAGAARLRQSLERTGEPLPETALERFRQAWRSTDPEETSELIQRALDPECLLLLHIKPGPQLEITLGPAQPALVEQGWRQFLVKVHNEAGVQLPLAFISPQAKPLAGSPVADVPQQWLHMRTLRRARGFRLSGQRLEYHVLQLFSRDGGRREADIGFALQLKKGDLLHSNAIRIPFACEPTPATRINVLDVDGSPAAAAFVFRDAQGRVYPPKEKRVPPDLAIHNQVYRRDGDEIRLPAGAYEVLYQRGPEYLLQRGTLQVTGREEQLEFQLARWIDPSAHGWWSGDTHLHAVGCAQAQPGLQPSGMFRHTFGEDLHVGCVLTWRVGFQAQSRFFTGDVHPVSTDSHLIRYDIEVSGFGSHRSGHVVLLGLEEQIYPGGAGIGHWPTLCLKTLEWAKAQGAVTGFGHAGSGLAVDSTEVPNYLQPRYDGIGANEFVVDVTHEVDGPNGQRVPAVDYLGVGSTPPYWELNVWYHVLNCGFRTRIAGETDFPCLNTTRVGVGRHYVGIEGPLTFDKWLEGVRTGRGYVSDGHSHLMDLHVGGVAVGQDGSELALDAPGTVTVKALVAASLDVQPNVRFLEARRKSEAEKTRRREGNLGHWPFVPMKPYWNLELARMGSTREVPVEVIVNGQAVVRRGIVADGSLQELEIDVEIERSSWVALRIYPSSHTNPVFVTVGGQPIRASAKSAEWCLDGVDRCWEAKQSAIRPREKAAAEAAYEHAREAYRRILAESPR